MGGGGTHTRENRAKSSGGEEEVKGDEVKHSLGGEKLPSPDSFLLPLYLARR